MSDARQLLADAQAAEVKGDKAEAIKLLRKAAEFYRDKQLANKALKVLRHIRRLEGIDEDALEQMPFETQVFEGPVPARTMSERGPVLADPKLEAWCSFCCRPHTEVGRLVAAPTGTFICAACIKVATEMLG